MTENEILVRGIVAGMAIVLPFLGITIARWHSWKGWAKYWQMMHKDLSKQNERLFRAVKSEEDRAKYFESKLKFVIEQYKPIGPINRPTDNNKSNAIELLKPRVMENGCEYYLAGEVRLCIEQAARQIAESNSVYKELDSIINHQKFRRCIAMASKCRLRARWFGDNAFYKKEQWALLWHRRWLKLAEKFKEEK